MTGKQLVHPYITRVELTHRTALPVREHWEEVQEWVAVENIPLDLEHEEVINLLSCHQILVLIGRGFISYPL